MPRDYVLQPFRAPVNLQIDYEHELNPQQHAAVTAPPGPSLVLAGAGAGKTRTLIYRVAYLLEQGIPANRILLLTFTNKAAKEMMRRVADLLGNDLADLWGGTFHSIGNRVLRKHAGLVGYRPDFTILDREDAKGLIKACLGEAEIDLKATRFPKPDVLGDIFSLAVNTQKSIPEIVAEHYPYFSVLTDPIIALDARYQARKRAANVMDFDDLLVLWLKLLREQAEVCEQYQRKFQFVLVDEYQDTNKIQSDLIDLLAARHGNVMVVGDDSQSIYSWRGANFRNILEFPKRYPKAAIYKIETNYRSTPEILACANAAISPNINQFAKVLTPARKQGPKPILVTCEDTGQQAAFVAQRLLELREEGGDLNKMAVLYRSHFHALELQLELTRRNIPFTITSGIRFFEQAHIKDVTAYLKWVCNPRDEMAFKRIVQLLPGIGAKAAEKLWQDFQRQPTEINPPRTEAGQPGDRKSRTTTKDEDESDSTAKESVPVSPAQPLATALQACAASVPKKAARAWADLVITVSQLEPESVRHQPSEMIGVVIESGYEDYLQDTYTNYSLRLEDLQQLGNFALQFQSTEEFLAQLSLLSNLEAEQDRPAQTDTEHVKLSTIHQAKGLEFDAVFIIMLCENLFPSARSLKDLDDLEEERRLFYVAITRARNELYLSYPLMRFTRGAGGDFFQEPSRFLREIPAELIEEWNLKPANAYR
ncbi:MAG TPA: ATP-dependent helicase [Candidatus Eisenbacteria bacterium]|nr:ATP-dependent helicase [Candidatus Eisenbacteria bacterium]